MLQIGDKVVSLELLEEKFICDLDQCKGQCCVDGESGAPLEEGEKELIEKNFPLFKKYLRKESIKSIEKQGFSVIDRDGETVTPLLNEEEMCLCNFRKWNCKMCHRKRRILIKKLHFENQFPVTSIQFV
ncbi:MAG: DUF3109 family protein [Marinilabiliales bacterium]|nr:DUF3109 family protein [Marinilabiliales bacterium]